MPGVFIPIYVNLCQVCGAKTIILDSKLEQESSNYGQHPKPRSSTAAHQVMVHAHGQEAVELPGPDPAFDN